MEVVNPTRIMESDRPVKKRADEDVSNDGNEAGDEADEESSPRFDHEVSR